MNCINKLTSALTSTFVFCAFAHAEQFLPIESGGTYTVNSGDYTASSSWIVDAWSSNIVINVDEGGAGSVNLTTQNTVWMLDAYGNYDSKTGGGSIVWNGNLALDMQASYNDFKPVLANDGGSSIILNGDLSISAKNNGNYSFHNSFLIASEYYSTSNFNGNLDLSATTTNSGGDSIGSAVSVLRGENVYISLGESNSDKMRIHDIITESTGGAESYGIYGYNYGGYNLNYVIDVKASTLIEDLSATSDASYSYAVGAEVHGGTLNFLGDLEIKNIKAETALALAAYNGGKINVNEDLTRTVKIDGDIETFGANSQINLNLSNADSQIKGSINSGDGAVVSLSLSDGSSWFAGSESTVSNLKLDGANLVMGSGAKVILNSEFTVAGDSSIVFNATDRLSQSAIVLSEGASFDITGSLSVKLILGEYYKSLSEDYEMLLIDAEGIVESSISSLENLSGGVVWEESGESAEGWILEYISGEGLYAIYSQVPEPATVAAIFGAIALFIAGGVKRRK